MDKHLCTNCKKFISAKAIFVGRTTKGAPILVAMPHGRCQAMTLVRVIPSKDGRLPASLGAMMYARDPRSAERVVERLEARQAAMAG